MIQLFVTSCHHCTYVTNAEVIVLIKNYLLPNSNIDMNTQGIQKISKLLRNHLGLHVHVLGIFWHLFFPLFLR
jgi:hypothetical protein